MSMERPTLLVSLHTKLGYIHKIFTEEYTGSAKKMYTHFNERKLLCCMLVLNLIIHHKLNTSYSRAQYKFPVPVQLMEVLKVVAVSG